MYYLSDQIAFPHPTTVKKSGILAIGGDLSTDRLILAYNFGIYPWYNPDEPIIWWCPSPRFVIFPPKVRVPKSMNAYFNQNKFRVTFNKDFGNIIRHCQKIHRPGQDGTWLTNDMVNAYEQLFKIGYIRSVEVWEKDDLVGGLYGVEIGKMFFGESMFSLKPNASKFGFITLAKSLEVEGFTCIDCQQPNPYLESLGGEFIAGETFHSLLRENRNRFALTSLKK
ncbi:MAG: leucyl/phenylalanyl-tRNA--protein transferase [Saprospiraceae bacterium]